MEDVESVTGKLPSGDNVAGVVVLSVVASVVLVFLLIGMMAD